MFRKRGFFALTWNFYKENKNIHNAFKFFWIPKISSVKYKISAPISLAETKMHIYWQSKYPHQLSFSYILITKKNSYLLFSEYFACVTLLPMCYLLELLVLTFSCDIYSDIYIYIYLYSLMIVNTHETFSC